MSVVFPRHTPTPSFGAASGSKFSYYTPLTPLPGREEDRIDEFLIPANEQLMLLPILEYRRNRAREELRQLFPGDPSGCASLLQAVERGQDFRRSVQLVLNPAYGPVPLDLSYNPSRRSLSLDVSGSLDQGASVTIQFDAGGRPQAMEFVCIGDKFVYYPVLKALGDGFWADVSQTSLNRQRSRFMVQRARDGLNGLACIENGYLKTFGSVKPAFVGRVLAELAQWPEALRTFLFEASQPSVVSSIVERWPEYKGQPAGGHGKDMLFDEATGIYRDEDGPEKPDVAVGARYYDSDGFLCPNPEPGKTIGHEWGHLFSHQKGLTDQDEVFIAAYRADRKAMSPLEKKLVGHLFPEKGETLESRLEELRADLTYALIRADEYAGQLPPDSYEATLLHCFNHTAALIQKPIEEELGLKLKVDLSRFRVMTLEPKKHRVVDHLVDLTTEPLDLAGLKVVREPADEDNLGVLLSLLGEEEP